MEDRVQKELWEVMASAEIELLEVLTTTQRDTARQALGKYFLYEDALKLKDSDFFVQKALTTFGVNRMAFGAAERSE